MDSPAMMQDLAEGVAELFAEAQGRMQDRRLKVLYAWHWRKRIKNNGAGWPTIVGGTAYCKDGYTFKVPPPQCRTENGRS